MRSLNHGNYASKIKFEGGNFTKMQFISQASRLALRSPMAAAVACGSGVLFAPAAYAACNVNATAGTVQCTQNTVTTDATYPTGGGSARHLSGTYNTPVTVTVADDVVVSGMGLGVTNAGTGGVIARIDGDVRIDTNPGPKIGPGFVAAQGFGSSAIGAAALGISAAGGDILVTGSGNIDSRLPQNTGRHGDGLYINNGGSGKVTIDLPGTIFSRQKAIRVRDTVNGGDIRITAGDRDSGSTLTGEIFVSSGSATANVSIISNFVKSHYGISVSSQGSGSIYIQSNTKLDMFADTVTAINYGTGSVTIEAAEDIESDNAAMRARTHGGDINITARALETFVGIGYGLEARQANAAGAGNIDVEVTGVLRGRGGIELANEGTGYIRAVLHEDIIGRYTEYDGASLYAGGDIDALLYKNATGVGNGARVVIIKDGTGNINFTGLGDYRGQVGSGLLAQNYGTGYVNINVTGLVSSDTVTALRVLDYYIVPSANWGSVGGLMDVVAGSVRALGTDANADGIEVSGRSANAAISLTVNGDIEANRNGVLAELLSPDAAKDIMLSTKGDVTAATGIRAAHSGTGNVEVTQAADTVITASNGHGIWAASQSGNTVVNVGGKIIASAPGFAGVAGQTSSGNLTVNVAAAADIDPDYGINLTTVDGNLLVNHSGTVDGSIAAISLNATGTGTAAIINNGLITSAQDAVAGVLNGGAYTVTNNNRFDGAVNVSGSNIATSTLTNSTSGTANFGTLASSFSGNFVNAGIANIGAGGSVIFLGNTTNSSRINLAGNSLFRTNGNMTNSGIINASNGVMTDQIVIGGRYVGGGQLLADFNGSAMTADHMTIGGDASGTTLVTMNRVGPVVMLNGGFLPVVTVSGAAPADAFVGSILSNGLVQESFAQNPNNSQQYGVLQSVNPGAGSLAGISLIAEAASAGLDEPMRPYITGRTDSDGGRGHMGLWMRLGGGRTDQRVQTTISGGPLALVSTDDVRTKFWSAQLGLDYAMVNMGGGLDLHLGVMGGWYSGDSHFGNGSLLKVEAPFAGVYAIVDYGGLSIEASVRREWRRYKALLPGLLGDAPREFDGSATAASIYASYRLGGDTGFSATPFVGFQYASADMDDLDIDAQTRFVTDKDKSKVGRAGIRVGYRFGDPASVTIEPFGGVSYLRNWSRGVTNAYVWDTAATTFESRAETWRETVRYSAGLDIRAHHSRVTGFVAANLDDGGRRDGKSVHAGLRLNF